MNPTPDEKIDYLYKEYVRLSEKSDELIKSTFDDVKFYGAIGVVIAAWKPVFDLVSSINPRFDASYILFLGFLSLLAIVGLITYLSLFKQAYVWYFIHHIKRYELELKKIIVEKEESQLFNFNSEKESTIFITAVYKIPFKFMGIVFSFFTIIIPSVILWYAKVKFSIIYLAISLLGSAIYLYNFNKVMRQFSTNNYL